MQGMVEITVAGIHGVDGSTVVAMQGTVEITVVPYTGKRVGMRPN
jgi:hypothetical protein